MCGHAEIRVEIDTKVANDGGRSNGSGPHAKRNLWDLELSTTRREPKDHSFKLSALSDINKTTLTSGFSNAFVVAVLSVSLICGIAFLLTELTLVPLKSSNVQQNSSISLSHAVILLISAVSCLKLVCYFWFYYLWHLLFII